MKVIEQYFHVVLFIVRYKVVLTFCTVFSFLVVYHHQSIFNTPTGFQHLRILGLSSTRISNKLLLNGTLNHCKNLARLNLSRTRVSNKRLTHLVLPLLSQLNLDWTRVTSDCRTLLTGRLYITCWRIAFDKRLLVPLPLRSIKRPHLIVLINAPTSICSHLALLAPSLPSLV